MSEKSKKHAIVCLYDVQISAGVAKQMAPYPEWNIIKELLPVPIPFLIRLNYILSFFNKNNRVKTNFRIISAILFFFQKKMG